MLGISPIAFLQGKNMSMMHLLRRLSGISLIVAAVSAILIGLDVFSPQETAVIALMFIVVTMLVSGLCFAVGIIGLIVSGSRRQWGWFVAMLVPLILVNFGPRLFFVDSDLNEPFIENSQGYNLAAFILMTALPAVIPVLALAYCYVIERSRQPMQIADDGLELEYSTLPQSEGTDR